MEINIKPKQFLMDWGFRIGMTSFFAVAVFSVFMLNQTGRSNEWVLHTQKVMDQLSQTLIHVERAETSQRGYLIARREVFLASFEESSQSALHEVKQLADLVKDNPTQAENVIGLRLLIERRIEKMNETLALLRGGMSLKEIEKRIDSTIMASLRAKLSEMYEMEKGYLSTRLQESASQMALTRLLIAIAGLVGGLLVLLSRRLNKAAEEERLSQTALLNQIVESFGDGLVVVNPDNKFTHFNPAAEKMLGMGRYTGTGESRTQHYGIFDIKTNKILDPTLSPLSRALRGEIVDDFEMGLRNASHPEGVVISCNARPIYREQKVVAAVSLFRDVTKRKKLEQQLESSRMDALEASRMKSDALASMSHEIRTPMNGVIGMTTLLLDTKLDANQFSYARTIKGSAEALLALINDLLDHAKIESGKLSLDEFDFHLGTLVNDTLGMFRFNNESKRLLLETRIAPDADRWFKGDGHRVRQILINLVGNSMKFTEKGSITVSVKLEDETFEGRAVRFEVIDTGIGISRENQDKLFGKFIQVHEDKGKYGGTGLGLALAREFARMMGGDMGVESVEGLGSKFWFTLRLKAAAEHTDIESKPLSQDKLAGHALVAEDQPVNREVVRSYLSKLGMTCEIQNNGKLALEAYRKNPDHYDLVLMDCQMPVMDGYAATAAIRSFEKEIGRDPIPVLALTAEGRSGDRDRCFASGMDDFLVKPIDLTQFQATLYRWLNKGATCALPPGPLELETQIEADTALFNSATLNKYATFKSEDRPLDIALMDEFFASSPKQIDELEHYLRVGPPERVEEVAHAMKSVALSVGLEALGTFCERLELKAPDDAEAAATRLRALYLKSCEHLRQHLDQRRKGFAA